jgi:Family of unknown function (DUF5926)
VAVPSCLRRQPANTARVAPNRLFRVSKRRRGPRAAASRETERKRPNVREVFVPRPFAGLVDERDWIALRELVPAATSPVRLAAEVIDKYGDRPVTVATVLPMAWPALTKPDGRIFLGLQRSAQSGDVSRDVAHALLLAFEAESGAPVVTSAMPGDGPRLQDLLADGALEITMRDDFEFWLDEGPADAEVKASLERANASIYPTVKLAAAPAAYWCRVPGRAHVRWVLPEDEDTALVGLARLSAAGELTLGDDTKFAGMFRAHGLLVPVWDLPREADAGQWEEPMAELAVRYAEALTIPDELTAAERRSRQGLLGRQLTLR